MSWRKLADTVAGEANHRAGMGLGRRGLNLMTAGNASRYNLFVMLILSVVSFLTGLSALAERGAVLHAVVMLFLIEVMLGPLDGPEPPSDNLR